MTDWARLHDAYGTAEAVPALLAEAATATAVDDEIWSELWSRLCHQGTVYSASYAALPYLAQLIAARAPVGYVAPLHLAAAIVGSDDGPESSAAVRQRHAEHLPDLRAAAIANLAHAANDIEFVYGLQAVVAFESGGGWQHKLECLTDGEVDLQCPRCDNELLVEIPGDQVVPVISGYLAPGPVEDRLHTLALKHRRWQVAYELRFLFGTTTCPNCAAIFQIPTGMR